jgi:hypothetical protein
MDITSKIFGIIANLFTISAIVWGIYWTYFLFIKNRQKYPRADVKHKLVQKYLGYGKILLHVDVEVINLGDVLISLKSGHIRLLQVLPLCGKIDEALQADDDPVGKGKTELDWYQLSQRKLSFEPPCEIEPKESEVFPIDFVIKNDVQTIEIYSYFRNQDKDSKEPNKELGWDCTTIHDIEGGTTE